MTAAFLLATDFWLLLSVDVEVVFEHDVLRDDVAVFLRGGGGSFGWRRRRAWCRARRLARAVRERWFGAVGVVGGGGVGGVRRDGGGERPGPGPGQKIFAAPRA